MATISDRQAAIGIEYDCRGKREVKEFDDVSKARHFYAAKLIVKFIKMVVAFVS